MYDLLECVITLCT